MSGQGREESYAARSCPSPKEDSIHEGESENSESIRKFLCF